MGYMRLFCCSFAWVLWTVISAPDNASAINIGKAAPEIAGEPWINSAPLTINVLKGRVVLVEFWTYG
jgi:hypothetical protein